MANKMKIYIRRQTIKKKNQSILVPKKSTKHKGRQKEKEKKEKKAVRQKTVILQTCLLGPFYLQRFKPTVFLLIFCLDILSIIASRLLKFYTIIILLSIFLLSVQLMLALYI